MRRPAVIVLIAVFLAIVIGAAGYFLLVAPKKSQIDSKQKEIEATQNKIDAEKNTYKQLTDIKNRSAEFEARLAELQAKIPQNAELPSLIRLIQAAADPTTGAGCAWLSFAPTDLTTSTTGTGFSTYTFNITVAGFYDQITDLIYLMERFTRAVVVDSVSMTPTASVLEQEFSQNLGLINAAIGAHTFTFATPPSAAGAAPTAPTTPTPSSAR